MFELERFGLNSRVCGGNVGCRLHKCDCSEGRQLVYRLDKQVFGCHLCRSYCALRMLSRMRTQQVPFCIARPNFLTPSFYQHPCLLTPSFYQQLELTVIDYRYFQDLARFPNNHAQLQCFDRLYAYTSAVLSASTCARQAKKRTFMMLARRTGTKERLSLCVWIGMSLTLVHSVM
jgi:hypothetical protein